MLEPYGSWLMIFMRCSILVCECGVCVEIRKKGKRYHKKKVCNFLPFVTVLNIIKKWYANVIILVIKIIACQCDYFTMAGGSAFKET